MTLAIPPCWRYGLPVTVNPVAGFGDPMSLAHKRPNRQQALFFVPAAPCHGGCAWETFGSAGYQGPGSPTCAQLPPLLVWRRVEAAPFQPWS